MKILRLEDANGYGPFMGNPRGKSLFSLVYTNQLPFPVQDGIRLPEDIDRCDSSIRHGCQTFDLLLLWFGPALKPLAEDEFGIAEYEVDDCLIGKHQVVFFADKAEKKCWIPLKELIS